MAWIKRNLFFVIMLAVGVGVTVYCGILLVKARGGNNQAREQYGTAKSSLDSLERSKPYPSTNNIAAAAADAARASTLLANFRDRFANFPTPPKVDDRQFTEYLHKTVAQFGAEATNAGVQLNRDFDFAWGQQLDKWTFPSNCLEGWMRQLEEERAILHILYNAKILYLEVFRRQSVAPEDLGGDEFDTANNASNKAMIISPYKVEFRAFSGDLAKVLSGFASASNCMIVKMIYVTPSRVPLPQTTESEPAPTPTPFYRNPQPPPVSFDGNPDAPFRRSGSRLGGLPGMSGDYSSAIPRRNQPAQAQQPAVAPPAPTTVRVLAETPLYVTLYIDVVKLKAPETNAPAAPSPIRPRMAGN